MSVQTVGRRVKYALSWKASYRGLTVSMLFVDSRDRTVLLQKIRQALDLIASYDQRSWQRFKRYVRRIHLAWLLIHRGRWLNGVGTCELDEEYVRSELTLPEDIAGSLIHEMTHARLWALGISPSWENRARIERLCYRAQRNFGKRLPGGDCVVAAAEEAMRLSDAAWTREAAIERRITELRRLGTSEWLVRLYSLVLRSRAA